MKDNAEAVKSIVLVPCKMTKLSKTLYAFLIKVHSTNKTHKSGECNKGLGRIGTTIAICFFNFALFLSRNMKYVITKTKYDYKERI